MRAGRMTAPGVLEQVEIPTPTAGPGEVLLRVGAVGACHSDLHILDAPAGGQVMLVGLAGGTLPVRPVADEPPPIPLEATARVPFWGTRAELQEVIALGRLGMLQADVQTFPLERAPEPYELLRRGEIHGRAVIVP